MLTARVRRVNLPLAAAWLLLRRLLYAAFVVVLVTLASALATAVVPRLLGYGTLVVQGASMGDAAPVGSLVIARWTEAGDVAPGDVILIREASPSTARTATSWFGPKETPTRRLTRICISSPTVS